MINKKITRIVKSHKMENVTVTLWFEYCSQLEYETVMKRLKNHIRKSPYPPVVADLAVTTKHDEYDHPYLQWMNESSIK